MTCGVFETIDIDLAAFLEVTAQQQPSVHLDPATGHVTFHFLNDSKIHAQLVAYSTGSAVINAKRLLSARRRLFHEVRRVQREGRL